MIRYLPALAVLALLAGCEPAPVVPGAASTPSVATAPTPVHNADDRASNPLLNVPPDAFMSVIGDCGNKLFGKKPDGSATIDCLAEIRASARKAGLGEISDIQLADPYISERWRSEMAKQSQH
ncbi:hypothetical protein [Jeongeupia naejangsanensis]|uniref:Lipoprotein n=1 Tax=Jeongeupia naejangsanensis TaxID=613195 RepID=A0ABS2BGC3_9NEIS|nr:hypothetical protein [Jeongeupia naejangsanensis]MBM3114667.1 hypothetical protein [Jeongeupia naejangsanensis]